MASSSSSPERSAAPGTPQGAYESERSRSRVLCEPSALYLSRQPAKVTHGPGMVVEAALIGAVLIVPMADVGGISDLCSLHRS